MKVFVDLHPRLLVERELHWYVLLLTKIAVDLLQWKRDSVVGILTVHTVVHTVT